MPSGRSPTPTRAACRPARTAVSTPTAAAWSTRPRCRNASGTAPCDARQLAIAAGVTARGDAGKARGASLRFRATREDHAAPSPVRRGPGRGPESVAIAKASGVHGHDEPRPRRRPFTCRSASAASRPTTSPAASRRTTPPSTWYRRRWPRRRSGQRHRAGDDDEQHHHARAFMTATRIARVPAGQLYIGGFYRTTGATGAAAQVTATVPAALTNAGGSTIPFSKISWTSSGNGDTGSPARAVSRGHLRQRRRAERGLHGAATPGTRAAGRSPI